MIFENCLPELVHNGADFMKSFIIDGSLFGKEFSSTPPSKTRALLPLHALLQCADAIIACVLHNIIDHFCKPPLGIMFGARKGTQVMDISHAVHLHLQKGADNFNQAGLAQGDISTYYSSIDGLTIANWLVASGSCDVLF